MEFQTFSVGYYANLYALLAMANERNYPCERGRLLRFKVLCLEPAVTLPVFQGHLDFLLRKSSAPTRHYL